VVADRRQGGSHLLFLLLTTMYITWAERRLLGRIRSRLGPNRAVPVGLLQPVADGLNLVVRTPLQLTHLPVAVLLVLAMSSVGVYGIVLAGWSSPSTYSLRGWLRSCAQVVSSEIGEFACAGGETVYQGVSLSCRRDILSFRHLAKAAALSGAPVPL
jgi:NADH-quinone oxidoreductase subunit H